MYYDDGLVYDGPLESTPGWGVVIVAQADEDVGKELLHRKDYYCFEGRWFGCDLTGLLDYLGRPGMRKVLIGRTTTHRNYHRLYELARTDPALPYKSARLTAEEPCG